MQRADDANRRLEQLRRMLPAVSADEYRIGAEDLIEVSVFEASELNRSVRVSAGGEVSLPLIGGVRAAGLTPRELEGAIEELLRRTYLKDPHVGVFVREMQSRPVSVVGAVKRPGVFQIRGAKTLVEVLAMAEGLAEDAGDTILVTHNDTQEKPAAPSLQAGAESFKKEPETQEIDLKRLIESGDSSLNAPIHPGDVVKVARAGVVYVIGDVKKPGGFTLRTNENITVLQALALAEGIERTAAKSRARIIRTAESGGERTEIPLDLGKIFSGKASDPTLQARDVLFVPGSGAKAALYRTGEAALEIATGVIIWRR
jgi:polysaccharide export outer membrane protein